ALPNPNLSVKTNLALAGTDFVFPPDKELEIADDTTFTIIFSPEPLTKPAFLAERALHELTASEQQELEEFRRQLGTSALNAAKTKMKKTSRDRSLSLIDPE